MCVCGCQTLGQLEAVHGGRTTQLPEEQRRGEAEIVLQLACWSAETGQAVKGDIIGGGPKALPRRRPRVAQAMRFTESQLHMAGSGVVLSSLQKMLQWNMTAVSCSCTSLRADAALSVAHALDWHMNLTKPAGIFTRMAAGWYERAISLHKTSSRSHFHYAAYLDKLMQAWAGLLSSAIITL